MKRIFQLVRKSHGLQILMAISLLITGVIVAYAVYTNKTNEKALESALEDKIQFASWVYNNSAEESLKQSSYQTLQHVLRSIEQNDQKLSISLSLKHYNNNEHENKNEDRECSTNYLKPVDKVFIYNPNSGKITSRGIADNERSSFDEWVKSEIDKSAPSEGRLYTKLYKGENNKEYGVFFARSTALSPLNRELIFGVKTDIKNLEALFKDIWENQKILPRSVAGEKTKDELLGIKILSTDGSQIFSSGDPSGKKISVKGDFSKEFGILQEKMAISKPAGLNLMNAGIQGESNIILFVLFSLAAGLGIIAFLQFKHETKLFRMKRDFISNISHELRTPVTQIRMFSETLLNKRTRNEEERKKSLQIIERKSKKLTRLISNILDFSEGENRILKTRPKEIQVDNEVRQVVQEFKPLTESASIDINLKLEPITACLDPSGFKQILSNVLDNAIKYGPEEQQIDITLRKDKNNIILSIADEGPGIAEELHDKVWEANWRHNNSSSRSKTGSGIGLYVVKQYLDQMNGTAEIKNSDVQGTEFEFRFPLNTQKKDNETAA